MPDEEPTDGNANDKVTESAGATNDNVADPRDETITQLTTALGVANNTIAGLRAALAAMIAATPADDTADEDDPTIEEEATPSLSELVENADKDND